MQRKRQKLGQHFLISGRVAESIVTAARIGSTETVFELGTGRGILTELLCRRAGKVISVEADERLAEEAKELCSKFGNLQLFCCDGLGDDGGNDCRCKGGDKDGSNATITSSDYDVFVSNLPYSESRRAVEHLARADFSRCVITVQREFADKLLQGDEDKRATSRRAVGVIAQYCFKISVVMNVSASSFSPPPKVDSTILVMTKLNRLDTEQIRMINCIFSYRRKMLATILRRIGGDGRGSVPRAYDENIIPAGQRTARIDNLSSSDIVSLADRILGRV